MIISSKDSLFLADAAVLLDPVDVVGDLEKIKQMILEGETWSLFCKKKKIPGCRAPATGPRTLRWARRRPVRSAFRPEIRIIVCFLSEIIALIRVEIAYGLMSEQGAIRKRDKRTYLSHRHGQGGG